MTMHVTTLPEEFQKALPVIETLENAGYEAYFVGGSVRDIIMGKAIHDVDIATSAFPAEVQALFSHTFDIGIEHGTVLVLLDDEQYEVTTFRTESTYQDYRRPDSVTFVRSLEEDLKRRDFRMNALAMKKDGTIIDLFDGVSDIQKKRICAVGEPDERFHEDALRMMRALRFASQLDFTIEPQTYQAISRHHELLRKISIERIQQEWLKLLNGKAPCKGIEAFIDTKCFESCPILSDYRDGLVTLSQTLLHGVNEPQAWLLISWCCKLDDKQTKALLKTWKCSNAMIHLVVPARSGLIKRVNHQLTDWDCYELGLEHLQLIECCLPHLQQEMDIDAITMRYQSLPIHSIKDLAVDGKLLLQTLDVKPGRWMGAFLSEAQRQIIAKNWLNERAFLIEKAKEFIEK